MNEYPTTPNETVALSAIEVGDVVLTKPTKPERVTRIQPLREGRIRLWVRSVYHQQFVWPRALRGAAGDSTITRVVP